MVFGPQARRIQPPPSDDIYFGGGSATPRFIACQFSILPIHKALASLMKSGFERFSPSPRFSKSTDTTCYNIPCAETFERLGIAFSATAPPDNSEEATCSYVTGY